MLADAFSKQQLCSRLSSQYQLPADGQQCKWLYRSLRVVPVPCDGTGAISVQELTYHLLNSYEWWKREADGIEAGDPVLDIGQQWCCELRFMPHCVDLL